ncbi:zinc ribbon domain-containing protein [Halorientalis brevis]|uniref:Zinc ribbon domain-containing protein n=1 Tax=Halorientalis brevis TaxID=1126241 RepID=A0ABD6CBA2_9EURY|nr:hypothetical protein [Halorientalis brevis]
MGFFNNLGRKVEEFKRDVDSAKADEATHQCTACDHLYFAAREECDECGRDAVVER